MDNGPHLRTARGRRRVASSHESRAGSARDRTVRRREREKWDTLHVVFHFPPQQLVLTACDDSEKQNCLGSSISMGSRQCHVACFRLKALSTSTRTGSRACLPETSLFVSGHSVNGLSTPSLLLRKRTSRWTPFSTALISLSCCRTQFEELNIRCSKFHGSRGEVSP